MQPNPQEDTPAAAGGLTTADADHLKILAIFHYVYAGLVAASGCCLSVYMIPGVIFATAANDPNMQNPPPKELGYFMIGIAVVGMLFIWGIAALTALAGRKLQQRQGHVFCTIIAGLLCLAFPIGTILGIFTLVVLMRPSVKQAFGVG